jgi:hypothetical protein
MIKKLRPALAAGEEPDSDAQRAVRREALRNQLAGIQRGPTLWASRPSKLHRAEPRVLQPAKPKPKVGIRA